MAKVSHPREQEYILALIRYYQNAEQRLIQTIAQKEAKGTVTAYSRSLLNQVEKIIVDLNEEATGWANTNIPVDYEKGIKSAVSGYATLGVDIGDVATFSKLNQRAINVIVRNTIQDLTNANNFIGRKVQDDIRQAGLDATAQKELTGLTVKQTKKNLINTLIDKNVMAIKTRNGRNMNISAYAETVARSTSREAQNRGLLDTVTTSNRDLVKMSSHLTTCPVCAPLQGRVYSISGTSTEYPPLEVAYGGVHANIHPNCRHLILPYVAELDEDREKVKAFSNRSFDTDPRSKSQIDNYNKQQKANAERSRDRRQWERYKMAMPNETPKTFSAFRKSKQSNSDKWQELESNYRSMRIKQSK